MPVVGTFCLQKLIRIKVCHLKQITVSKSKKTGLYNATINLVIAGSDSGYASRSR